MSGGKAGCPELEELEASLACGEALSGGLETHVAECTPCRELLAELRRDRSFAGKLRSSFRRGGLDSSVGFAERLGGYRILGTLGAGGMGVVYLAEQDRPRRRVALKVLPRERGLLSRDQQRFYREAEACGRLQHPGIVTVYEVGEVQGLHFIAQELVEGGRTLADHLDAVRRLPTLPAGYYRDTAELVARVADALQAAHEAGVIHRDVKPANILLTADGSPKVADFGLARIQDAGGLSQTGEFAGTVFYVSPEQATGKRAAVDARSDVFSLGVTLYEALALVRPFDGETSQQILQRILSEDPPDPHRLRSGIPRELVVIALKALEKRPGERYASMRALAQDLRRHLRHEPILARPPGPVQRTQKWILRHPTVAMAVGLGSAALVAVLVLLGVVIASARRAELRAQDVLNLSEGQDLQRLIARADELWPAWPERKEDYERWLSDAQALLARLPEHREQFAALEERMRRSRPSSQDQWWARELEELIHGIEALADPETGLVTGLTPEHGLGVALRLESALSIEERTLSGVEARARWQAAITSISDATLCPAYGGLRIEPQLGLVPIGRDPHSGLWEFGHPETGAVPERDPASGELAFTEESGLVFVLLPGGAFWMGAQKDDPQGCNFDPQTSFNEGPVHRVTLRPFLMSKYEMTQGQWSRCNGRNPSTWPKASDHERGFALLPLLHPVEQVSWNDCDRTLGRLGLLLPTEAQWEYAARGGTTTPWWTGAERGSLLGAANLADQSASRRNFDWLAIQSWPELDDGFPLHAPVNSLRANPFGLHHVHGNVQEWCGDLRCEDYDVAADEWGVRMPENPAPSEARFFRGGSFDRDAYCARSSYRYNVPVTVYQNTVIGLRPARLLE